jgi:hypothetical protein
MSFFAARETLRFDCGCICQPEFVINKTSWRIEGIGCHCGRSVLLPKPDLFEFNPILLRPYTGYSPMAYFYDKEIVRFYFNFDGVEMEFKEYYVQMRQWLADGETHKSRVFNFDGAYNSFMNLAEIDHWILDKALGMVVTSSDFKSVTPVIPEPKRPKEIWEILKESDKRLHLELYYSEKKIGWIP